MRPTANMSDMFVRVTLIEGDKLGGNYVTPLAALNVDQYLRESEIGDAFRVELIEMTEEEYQNLPEFVGF